MTEVSFYSRCSPHVPKSDPNTAGADFKSIHNKLLWLFPWKLNWEWKLATFIYEHTNHQTPRVQLKATLILYTMESAIQFQAAFSLCLSSAIKKSVSAFCHNKPGSDVVECVELRAGWHWQPGGIPGDTAEPLRSGWCSAWTGPAGTDGHRGQGRHRSPSCHHKATHRAELSPGKAADLSLRKSLLTKAVGWKSSLYTHLVQFYMSCLNSPSTCNQLISKHLLVIIHQVCKYSF